MDTEQNVRNWFAKRERMHTVWTAIVLDQRHHVGFIGLMQSLSTAPSYYVAEAVNTAADAARDSISRRLADKVNTDPSIVDAGVTVHQRARSKYDASIVRISGDGIDLLAFDPWQTDTGVGVKFLRDGTEDTYDAAFFATMPDGTYGVFRREGEKRLPIDPVFGASLADIVRDNDEIGEWVQRDAETALYESLSDAVRDHVSTDGIIRIYAEAAYILGF